MKKILILLFLVVPLFAITTPDFLTTKNMKKESTSGGNYVADAVANSLECDLALINTCDLKETTLTSCELTKENVLDLLLLPNNKIGIIEVNGHTLKKIINKSLVFYPKPNPAFLQVAGINVEYDSNKKEIISFKVNGNTLELDKTYKVAMSEELGSGVNGYWKIWDPKTFSESDITISEALNKYVNQNSIRNLFLKRIVIKNL